MGPPIAAWPISSSNVCRWLIMAIACPVLSFEVVRPVDGLARMIRAVDLIPGSTEFGYDTVAVTQLAGYGVTQSENRNQTTDTNRFPGLARCTAGSLPQPEERWAGRCLVRR